jgi:hypothetical protein
MEIGFVFVLEIAVDLVYIPCTAGQAGPSWTGGH